jgi:hypothetical protein
MIHEVVQKYPNLDKGDMRYGSNKHRSIDSVSLIMNFLMEKPYSTLAEIFKEFQNLKSTYSKKAINLMLHKLEETLKIKNTEVKGKHPRYVVIDTSEFTVKRDSYAFKDQICANDLSLDIEQNEFDMIKPYPNNFTKKTISESIFKFGIISLYTCLASYRRSMSPKNNQKENKKLHELWLRNAMSFENNIKNYQRFSGTLDSKLRHKLESERLESKLNKDTKDVKEEDMDYSIKKATQKETIDSAKELENTFAKMFPEWYESFQSSENLIDNHINDLMRKVCIEHPEYLLA